MCCLHACFDSKPSKVVQMSSMSGNAMHGCRQSCWPRMRQTPLPIVTASLQPTAVARDSLLCKCEYNDRASEPTAAFWASLQEHKADEWHQQLLQKLLVVCSRLSSLAQDALSAQHEAGVTEWLGQQGFVQGVACPAAQLCLFCIPNHASSMHAAVVHST